MVDLTVGFVGMSHLGIVSATASAAKGFLTIGYDDTAATVEALSRGVLPVVEPDLTELVARNSERLHFTCLPEDLKRCDVVYIARDVPTDDQGVSDIAAISNLISRIVPQLRADAVIVILCQVPPGFTRKLSDLDPRFHYQVETLIFGRAVQRALYPERLIVGKPNRKLPLPQAFKTVLSAFNCPILEMRLESAELAKISINMCLVASIGVANTMAGICETIGADWSEIVPALKLDARIGSHAYLTPGLGLSGGNLERDLATVRKIAGEYGCDYGVVTAWVANSDLRKDWAYRVLRELVLDANPNARIAVLGLAYKENTHSVKNAASLKLLDRLKGRDVVVYDPVVDAAVVAPSAESSRSAMGAVQGADAVVIVTPWPEFARLDPVDLARGMKGRTLIDPYAMIDREDALAAGLSYATLGTAALVPAAYSERHA